MADTADMADAADVTDAAADGDQATQTASQVATQIAIDGGAGAGKSTVGERLAQRLSCLYVDSGAFYRALTALAQARDVAVDDEAALVALAQAEPITMISPTVDEIASDGRQYTVLAAGKDITPGLRTLAVEGAVSQVARHPDVRRALIAQMRAMADAQSVVMVGRDIGTVVLPNAALKIYLTASLDARAERRHADLLASEGDDAPTLEAVRADLEARDIKDAAQMRPAENAYTISNDGRTVDEVVEQIAALLAGGTHQPGANSAHAADSQFEATGPGEDGRAGGSEAVARPGAETGASSSSSAIQPRGDTDDLSKSQGTPDLTPVQPGVTKSAYRAPAFQGRDPRAQRVLDGTASPWFYRLMRMVAACAFLLIARLRVEGVENVPTSGPVMLAVNHVAWPDIPMVPFRVRRITHYMAKIELFQIPILRTVIRLLGAFPVRRGDGDRESLRTAERLLRENEALIIFPEGHRTGGHLIKGLPGVALIALRANAPIVPVAISGTEHVFKGLRYGPFAPRVTIRYGKPFLLPQGSGRRSRDDLERGVEIIMQHIAELLPPEYRGIYADAVTDEADDGAAAEGAAEGVAEGVVTKAPETNRTTARPTVS